jgi:hypothetical protein
VEQYRGWIVVIAALAGGADRAVRLHLGRGARVRLLDLFDPAPTASPGRADPELGLSAGRHGQQARRGRDQGHLHVLPAGQRQPLQRPGQGPIRATRLRANDKTIPQGWVHNLEHGALVLLYRGDSGGTPEGQQQLRTSSLFPPRVRLRRARAPSPARCSPASTA